MDGGFSIEEFLFHYRWYILFVILGLLLIVFGIVAVSRSMPWLAGSKVEILSATISAQPDSGKVVVEVSGAVEKPGVYRFEVGSRIEELLVAAGGLSAQADRQWVAQTLNQAAKLTDGQKIYIPEKGQSSNLKSQNYNSKVKTGPTGDLININTALQLELEALPGIGPVTANKIIEGRPYSAVEELLTRKILKKSVYEENKEKLSIY